MSRPIKHSFSLNGHQTSVSLEEDFWSALKEISRIKELPTAEIVASIDRERGADGLSSAVRSWILDYYKSQAVSGPLGDQGS